VSAAETDLAVAPLRAANGVTPAQTPGRALTLRAKGALTLAALIVYLLGMCVLVVLQREGTLRAFDDVGALHAAHEELARAALTVAQLSGAAKAVVERSAGAAGASEVADKLAAIALLAAAAPEVPETRASTRQFAAAAQAYRSVPGDERAAAALESAARLAGTLDAAAGRMAAESDVRALTFRGESLVSTVTLVVIGGLGIALLAVVVVLFFARISRDLQQLRLRTVEIVDGAARQPMPLGRFDEVGQLAGAINELAVALDRREHDLELERRKAFHHEKMAAIGSLAAGVLTEIGNPIAAIDGYARAMKDGQEPGGTPAGRGISPDAILEQTARLTVIAHEIAELAAPQPSQRQLIDLNGVVEKALGLLRFDDAMRGVDMAVSLDRQLPALPGMTDRLVQLVMNLVGNAADAVRERPGQGGRIRIATRRSGDCAILDIGDNGVGMADDVRRRAFEPFFSTKPAGTGLGLSLCRSIVDEHHGDIELRSQPLVGTQVTVSLPLPRADAPAHAHA